jgi:anti-sigma factor ChrR (cupin superfamily)
MSEDRTLPPEGSKRILAGAWAAGERLGERVRSLIDDSAGYRTMLLQVTPGPLGELHSHETIEQIYVLDGEFFDDEASYGPGDFVVRMPGTMHRAGSRGGCTMMVIYAPLAGPRA